MADKPRVTFHQFDDLRALKPRRVHFIVTERDGETVVHTGSYDPSDKVQRFAFDERSRDAIQRGLVVSAFIKGAPEGALR